MERMDGGQDTWAKWKATILAVPDVRQYLSDVEGFDPQAIEGFLAADGAIRPADWHVSEESTAAMARYYAWQKRLVERDEHSSLLDLQESRAAALSPSHDDDRR